MEESTAANGEYVAHVPCDRWGDVVRDTAREFGLTVEDDEVGFILGNHTGYPTFFAGDPEVIIRRQVAQYFVGSLPGRGA